MVSDPPILRKRKTGKKKKKKRGCFHLDSQNVSLKSEDAPFAEVMASAVQSCCKYDHLCYGPP